MRLLAVTFALCSTLSAADLILYNGRIVTADSRFSILQAISISNGKVLRVGVNEAVLRDRKPNTQVIDLKGKMVVPGLIDAHVHALGAGLSEFKRKLPPLNSIAEIQAFIRERARTTPAGEWIVVPRTLPPRLKEQRFPTKADLDAVTTHPVAFDGSYVWGANSMALRISGITRNTPNPPGGEIVKGPDGEPNGILRNASRLLKGVPRELGYSNADKAEALETMLKLYAAAGLTGIGDRAVTGEDVAVYRGLKAAGKLPVRVVMTWRIEASRDTDAVVKEIRDRPWTTNQGDDWLKFGSFKVTLDGGQSVGTAYQRMPYGAYGRHLYGQTNPDARGTLFVEPRKLTAIFTAARAKGWQLTSHAQGGGAIDVLLDVFEALDKVAPIRSTRSHVMHGSFMSAEALARMKRMGVLADVQPGWLYLDVPALEKVFGYQSMRYFFPLHSYFDAGIIAAGGSDHMIGHDKDKAVNPFNPFLNIWMAITRRTTEGKVIYPEEKVSRVEALRLFTNGPAYLQFNERKTGSLEAGKYADLVVLDRDYLTCPEDQIREIKPLATMVEGKLRYGSFE
ncbi:MAG: amidohydrolase [Bryobacterales bacterium]|nr:amidohydrolase [Bryobacterales bacterium]